MIVTDAMVERACMANIHPDTTPSDTERAKMRKALEAALAGEVNAVSTQDMPSIFGPAGPFGHSTNQKGPSS